MAKSYLLFGAINAGLCVILGAFAAHKLKAIFGDNALAIFQTGVQYHFYHSLALMLLGILMLQVSHQDSFFQYAGIAFIIGVGLFCGSLYGLSFSSENYFNGKWLGPITPLGGLCFIVGWIFMTIGMIKNL